MKENFATELQRIERLAALEQKYNRLDAQYKGSTLKLTELHKMYREVREHNLNLSIELREIDKEMTKLKAEKERNQAK